MPKIKPKFKSDSYVSSGKHPKWVTRFHRTKTEYAPSIDKEGLKAISPNMGENTFVANTKDLENVWLGDNPIDIPVLRRYDENSPDVTTYKVRIPYDVYWNQMKRNTMPRGRGSGKFAKVKPGQPSMFDEGHYKVDLIGEDIPPKYLQKLPHYDADALQTILLDYAYGDQNDLLDLLDDTNPNWHRNMPARLRGEMETYLDRASQAPVGRMPSISEELATHLMPYRRNDFILDFSRDHMRHLKAGESPSEALKNALNNNILVPADINDMSLSMGIYGDGKLLDPDRMAMQHGPISRGVETYQSATKPYQESSSMAWDKIKQSVSKDLNQRDENSIAAGGKRVPAKQRAVDSLLALPTYYADRYDMDELPPHITKHVASKVKPNDYADWYFRGEFTPIERGGNITNFDALKDFVDIKYIPPGVKEDIAPVIGEAQDFINNELKLKMPRDELRELTRLQFRNKAGTIYPYETYRWGNFSTPETEKILERVRKRLTGTPAYGIYFW